MKKHNCLFFWGVFFLLFSCLQLRAQSVEDTQGFFLDAFQRRKAVVPAHRAVRKENGTPTAFIHVDCSKRLAKVSPFLYGNNTNGYMGQVVTEDDLMNSLKLLSPSVMRYPGGNLSSVFFWNARPSNPPADVPDTILYGDKRRARAGHFWYGQSTRPSTLSVDNYYKLLRSIHSNGIITVNYSYGRYGMSDHPVQNAAHLAAEWVRYDHGRTRFWEIGNENYGPWQAGYKIDQKKNKDGQPVLISGELYGSQFKIIADSMRKAAHELGSDIKLGALLVERDNSHAGEIEKNWNRGFFRTAGNVADFFIVHSYYTPYEENSTIPVILNSAQTVTSGMIHYLDSVTKVCHVEMKPVALTEWNIFAIHSAQQTSYVNGMHAVLTLGELIRNRYGMACRWDLANGWNHGDDHGMFSKGDEPEVPKWTPRPVYYYMYYFQRFFGDYLLQSTIDGGKDIEAFCSSFDSGHVGVVAVNKGLISQIVEVSPDHFKCGKSYYYYTLTGGSDHGDFSLKVYINGKGPDLSVGGPAVFQRIKAHASSVDGGIRINIPPLGVVFLLIDSA